MGQLRSKQIVQTRNYLDPNKAPIPPYDFDYTFPITVYEAVKQTTDDNAANLKDELDSIYRLIAGKQDIIEGGNSGYIMTWTGMKGHIGSMEVVKSINTEPSLRSHQKVPSERAIGDLLDTKVSRQNFNLHITDNSIHITDIERTRWNSMAPLSTLQAHVGNSSVHVTEAEKRRWNSMAGQESFDNHIYDVNNPHNVTAHQVGTYTRRELDEMFENIRESFFNYSNISWDERNNQATLVEYHPANWNPNYVLGYGDSLPEVPDPTLTYFALKPVTDYKVNETQDCLIYIKRPGLIWQEVGFQNMNVGDMVIRYPDTTMFVWVQGRFLRLFTGNLVSSGSSSSGGNTGGTGGSGSGNTGGSTGGSNTGSGGSISGDDFDSIIGGINNKMWRPIIDESGDLIWIMSTETTPPDTMKIKGEDGYTPIKGVDYVDGKDGQGVAVGGNAGEVLVKLTDENYDTTWKNLLDVLGDLVISGGTLPDGVVGWDQIKDRPEIFDKLGDNENGFVTQKVVTKEFESIRESINQIIERIEGNNGSGGIDSIKDDLFDHINDFNNPHRVTASMIGAVSNATFADHTQNFNNPHNVTANQIGLGNVDNTSDLDKPISAATEEAINAINEKIKLITGNVDNFNYVSNVLWDNTSAILSFTFRDGSTIDINIPIADIFNSIYFDDTESELVIVLPDGTEHRVDIESLIQVYTGGITENIQVVVSDNNVIKATILSGSIGELEITPSVHLRSSPTTTTQPTSDKSNRIATTEYVRNQVIDNLISYETDRPLSANMGRILNQRKADTEDVINIINDLEGIDVIDNLDSTNPEAALSANMGRYLDLTKAPRVHTSPSGSTFGRATISLFGHTRASDVDPLMDGTVFRGTDDGYYARADHRHPTDTTRAPIHFPDVGHNQYAFTGEPRTTIPADDSNDDRIPTTAWIRRNAIGVIKGECISAGNRSAKVATLRSTFMDPVVFIRQIGSTVAVTFANEDKSGDDPTTLNVNKTGACKILFGGRELKNGMLGKNHTHLFVFDGEYWDLINPVPGTGMGDKDGIINIGPGRPSTEEVDDHTHVDEDYDGKCDICNKDMPLEHTCEDHDGDGRCDICNKVMPDHTHVDTTGNGKCDICDKVMPDHVHVDEDGDGKCDVCDDPMPEENPDHTHVDTTGNGKCDICDKLLHDHIDSTGDGKCDICGDDIHECIDNNDDGKCDICDEPMFGFEDDDDYGNIMNSMTGYHGVFMPGDGRVDTNGQVKRVWIFINFSTRSTDVEITLSKHKHAWAVKAGDGSTIRIRNPKIKQVTRSSCVVEFMTETYYPANSPCQLLYHTDKAWMNIKEVDHKHVDTTGNGKCDICDTIMPNHTHIDENNDGKCDICKEPMPNHTHVDNNHDNCCDICGKDMTPEEHDCIDTTGNGKCDICDKEVHECIDNNDDGKCDICDEPMFGFEDDENYGSIINSMTGYTGLTMPGDGRVDTNGQVKRACIAMNFSPRETDVELTLSTYKNAWALKMGDGNVVRCRNPKVLEISRSSAFIQFTLETYYPANSPCQLLYHTDKAWMNIKEVK